jgi:integrase
MARKVNKLTATMVAKTRTPGRYNDGDGLYLLVQSNDRASWVFRWRDRITGKLRDKGLGPIRDVALVQARAMAKLCREQVRAGLDPIGMVHEKRTADRLIIAKRQTFADCAEAYIDAHRGGWRNEKHIAQWTATLETYAAKLRPLSVADIDTGLVIACLEPIWKEKTETATRVRQRIEAVLGWATVRGYRTGDNPARWRGHLDTLLAKPNAIKNVEHMTALPHAEIGAFMVGLRNADGLGAKALELQILTAMRPGAVAGARWDEFDIAGKTWSIPAERMKTRKGHESGRTHTVPLSAPALALLASLECPKGALYAFPGTKRGTSITTAAMLKAARAVRPGVDSHGFRSTFRDWAAECTNYPRDLAEAALAHTLKDKTEAAYLRTKLVAKRIPLMAAWGKRCGQPDKKHDDGNVVIPIRRNAG